jgi:uncharacterized protein YbjT (DUF2867 family)
MAFVRLNYAVEMRYGVLVDIARRVLEGDAVDLSMGHVNVIWQGDANAATLRLLAHTSSPPFVLNVTGPETLAVRDVATELGGLLGRPVSFEGEEASGALLSDASRAREAFGPPRVSAKQLIAWVADWVQRGGDSLGKPTMFQVRDGGF